jgi:hypothetical protein
MKHIASTSLLTLSIVAQEAWSPTASEEWIPAREAHALAFDSDRGVVVLFGGRTAGSGGVLDDTWEWDGVRWNHRAFSVKPPGRYLHAMVYDAARKVIVMFGGLAYGSSRHPDTWVYDGTRWTLAHTLPSNEERFAVPMAYDSERQRVVRFGGAGAGGVKGDTQVWDGKTWTDLKLAGPPPRSHASMVYDSVRDRMVLYAGLASSGAHQDTWEFDGSVWIQRQTSVAPTVQYRYGMAFHPRVARAVLFGGYNTFRPETWTWDGSQWTKRSLAIQPHQRTDSPLVYDSIRDQILLFSGASQETADTWLYSASVRSPGSFDPFGAGCAGTAGVPRLAAQAGEVPFLGSPFRLELSSLPSGLVHVTFGVLGASKLNWNSIQLPLDLGGFGMPGCRLLVSHDWIQQVPKNGSTATWTLPVPHDAMLVGRRFYVQGVVADPNANAAGFVWSNGGEGLIGER